MNQSKNKNKQIYTSWDFIFGIVLGFGSLYIITTSFMMPSFESAIYSRPGIVPLITGVALLGLSILLILKSIRANDFQSIFKKTISIIFLKEFHRFIIISLATLLYIAILDITEIHFVILTAIFLLFLFLYFKLGIIKSTILAALMTVIVYAFFSYAFTMPMP